MVKTNLLAASLAGLLLAAAPVAAMVRLNGNPGSARHHDIAKWADKPGYANARHDVRPGPWGSKASDLGNPPPALPDLSPPPASLPDVLPLAGAVPEPDNWLMLIAGFGFIGLAMRRHAKAKPSRPPLFYG